MCVGLWLKSLLHHCRSRLLQMPSSSSCIRSCTTDTSTPKSAWVTTSCDSPHMRPVDRIEWPSMYQTCLLTSIHQLYFALGWTHSGPEIWVVLQLLQPLQLHFEWVKFFPMLFMKRSVDLFCRSSGLKVCVLYRCRWPRPSGASQPVALGHHWWVYLSGIFHFIHLLLQIYLVSFLKSFI